MQFYVVTLFPELFTSFAQTSLLGKAVQRGLIGIDCEPLRPHGMGKHLNVDDTPYGGGTGMVLRVDCVVSALEAVEARAPQRPLRVLLCPQGRPFRQAEARQLLEQRALVLVCGRYEGFDERLREHVDLELSLGDFVLAGGEVAAMAVMEVVARLVPGVLGNQASVTEESFSVQDLLEYPQYTRPPEYRGANVPSVLLQGNHQQIATWRKEHAEARTRSRRPDLRPEPSEPR